MVIEDVIIHTVSIRKIDYATNVFLGKTDSNQAKEAFEDAMNRLDNLLGYHSLHGEPALSSDVILALVDLCFSAGKLSTTNEGIPYGGYDGFVELVNATTEALTDGKSTAGGIMLFSDSAC